MYDTQAFQVTNVFYVCVVFGVIITTSFQANVKLSQGFSVLLLFFIF